VGTARILAGLSHSHVFSSGQFGDWGRKESRARPSGARSGPFAARAARSLEM